MPLKTVRNVIKRLQSKPTKPISRRGLSAPLRKRMEEKLKHQLRAQKMIASVVPKLPPAGPAIMPKPLKPVPKTGTTSTGSTDKSSSNGYEWLKRNGPILLLNFGSVCTLIGFSRQDVLELRVLTMTGNLCAITYFSSLKPMAVSPMAWSSFFAGVNAINIYKILDERSDKVTFSSDDEEVYVEHFLSHGVTPKQFSMIMAKSTKVNVKKGEVIVRQGDLLKHVDLVCKGHTEALMLNRHITFASSKPGNRSKLDGGDSGAWIGEISFLESLWQKDQLSRKKSGRRHISGAITNSTKGATPLINKNDKSNGQHQQDASSNNQPNSDGDPILNRTASQGKALHTIIAKDDCVLQRWSYKDLEEVMATSQDMRSAITRAMTSAIVGKVVNFTVSSRNREDVREFPRWTPWLSDWKQSGGAKVTMTRQ